MSNKTPKNNVEETALVPKPKTVGTVFLLILLAGAVLFLTKILFTFLSDKHVLLNNQKIDVTVVSTPKERERGLSGWNRLGEKQGMLFVFNDSGTYCMWMKDMKFAIDMVWLDGDKKVTNIKQNATPESYPEPFCNKDDAKYVLELPEGSVSKYGIKSGNQAIF
mgnify:CR=1 FL=1